MENVRQPESGQQPQPDQQPIGTSVMNTDVLKEPRGFMRILQCFFAMVAFATCANYSVTTSWQIICKNNTTVTPPALQQNTFNYPFRLDHIQPVDATCDGTKPHTITLRQPGDFKSDAEFFVFTGVVAFLGSMASIVVYVFFSGLYLDDQKKFPFYDFCFTVIVAVFWLSASAAWANGVSNLKYVANPDNWLLERPICKEPTIDEWGVERCDINDRGHFGGANASVVFGFLNFFLWASNLWFVYKETHWFAGRSQAQQMTNQA